MIFTFEIFFKINDSDPFDYINDILDGDYVKNKKLLSLLGSLFEESEDIIKKLKVIYKNETNKPILILLENTINDLKKSSNTRNDELLELLKMFPPGLNRK